jgi:hypothetical protein
MSPKKSDDSEIHVSGQANKPLSLPPHALTSEQFIEELNVHVDNGLTSAEAGTRLEEYGANSLDEGPGVQPVKNSYQADCQRYDSGKHTSNLLLPSGQLTYVVGSPDGNGCQFRYRLLY